MPGDDQTIVGAIRRQEERLARDPASLAFAQLADLYRKADGQLAPAQVELEAILEMSPKDVQCHRLAAEIQRRLGHIDEAVRHLEAAVAFDPSDRESQGLLSLLRAAVAPSGEATGLARVLIDDTFATVTFGALCLEQGCVEEAAQIFTRILRKNPDHREARERLESALRARQRRKG